MTEKELRRLNRQELLEMLVQQSKKLDRAKQSLQEAEEKLAQRELDYRESGNLAEAALRVNGFFTAAQKAAEEYTAKAKEQYDAVVSQAQQEAEHIISEASEKCKAMLQSTADEMEEYLRRIRPDTTAPAMPEDAPAEPEEESTALASEAPVSLPEETVKPTPEKKSSGRKSPRSANNIFELLEKRNEERKKAQN